MWQQYLVNGIVAGSQLGLLAASFALVYQTARFFSFSHASIFTLGAYAAYALKQYCGLPLLLAGFVAILAVAVAGWLQHYFIFARLLRRKTAPISLLLASLGLMVAIQNAISMTFGDELKMLSSDQVRQGITVGRALITPIQLWTLGLSITLLIVITLLMGYTDIGIRLRAVADDPDLALSVGLEPQSVTGLAFFIGSGLAAAAAILASLDTGLTPSMGFNALLMAVVAVVMGGVGSVSGALMGGLAIGLAENLMSAFLPITWIYPCMFLLLIVFLLVRPSGLIGQSISRR
jgi:branched-chain amino acid transport system permease protein